MPTIDSREAAEAWQRILRYGLGKKTIGAKYLLDTYFAQQVRGHIKPAPKPVKDPVALPDCTRIPQPFGNDELRCVSCGVVWSKDEERPACLL